MSHRIQTRDCTLYLLDGLAGLGAINDAGVQAGDTDMAVDEIVLNTADTDQIPVGAGSPWPGDWCACSYRADADPFVRCRRPHHFLGRSCGRGCE